MKKGFKQSLAVILSAVLLLTMLPFTASAAAATEDSVGATSGTTGDCTWTVENGVLIISGNGAMEDYGTSTPSPWLDLEFSEAVIERGVAAIGSNAFYNCANMTSVTIPDSVTSIGKDAFSDCSSLSSIQVDTNNTAFCSIDGNLYHKDATTLIQYATGKTADFFSIPGSVNVIGDSAFRKCTNLTTVTIPDSVTKIGYKAFSGCRNLSNVTIPNSVTTIDNNAFYGCSSLTSVSIPDSVTSIGNYAFKNCSSLTTAIIPNSVKSIGKLAFGYDASGKVENFTITGHKSSAAESYANENDFDFIEVSVGVTSGRTGNCTWKLENGVLTISGNGAMKDYNDPIYSYSITPPWQNNEVNQVVIQEGVTNIGNYAFSWCRNISSITIPSSVISIGNSAFYYSSNLSSITIPSSVISIGNQAFSGCRDLENITVVNNNPNYCSIDGNLYNKNATTLIQYAIGKTATSFVIPNSVNSINNKAFYSCKNLTSVTIPDSVTSIGNHAFCFCINLSSAIIPDSVTTIGEYAFEDCHNLSNISISNCVTSIEKGAFYQCRKFKNPDLHTAPER